MPDNEPRPTYRLTIRAQPSEVPAVQRLKAVLKRLLRSYDFQALAVKQLPEVQTSAPTQETAK